MKWAIGLSWMGSLIGAFILGQYFNSQWGDRSVTNFLDLKQQTASRRLSPTASDIQVKDKLVSTSTRSEFVDLPIKSPIEIVALVTELSDSQFSMNFSGIAKAYQYIEGMTEDELLEALNIILSEQSDADNKTAIMMFLAHYAKINPNRAMDFTLLNVNDRAQRSGAIMVTLGTWAEQNPHDAYSWFKMNSADLGGGATEISLVSIFSGLAKDNLNSTINKLEELSSNPSELTMAVMGIANTLSGSNEYQILMNSVQVMNDNRLIESALSAWSRKEPQDAAAWLETLDDRSLSDRLAQRMLINWLHQEPDQAANWYMNYPSETSRQARVNKVVQTMSYLDPEEALTWLQKQTNVDLTEPSKSLLQKTAYSNPEFSRENLYLIEDKKDKITVSHAIYQGLQKISQTKAREFLIESSFKDELLKRIEKSESYQQKTKSKR